MFALIEITDGSPPQMICEKTEIGSVSVYKTADIALFHAEPENTSPEEWVLIDEQGTFFSVVPKGKWFDLKPIKSDPVLAMQLMMKYLIGG